MLQKYKIFFATLIYITFSLKVHAAVFDKEIYNDLDCSLSLIGNIEPGDADRLAKHTKNFGRICLNSRGGSFLEAFKIIDFLQDYSGNFSTRIPPNAECLSACALIFLAGSAYLEGEAARILRRDMHVSSILGFHAPGLNLSDGQFGARQMEEAYRTGLAAIGLIIKNSDVLGLFPSAIQKIVETSPKDIYYIDTNTKANTWMIDIYGAPMPLDINRRSMVFACDNSSIRNQEEAKLEGSSITEGFWSYYQNVYFNKMNKFKAGASGRDEFYADLYLGEAGGYGCEISFSISESGSIERSLSRRLVADFVVFNELNETFFYPRDTLLREISTIKDTIDQTEWFFAPDDPDEILPRTSTGSCYFIASDHIEEGSCSRERLSSIDRNAHMKNEEFFYWTSGRVDVFERAEFFNRTRVESFDGYFFGFLNDVPASNSIATALQLRSDTSEKLRAIPTTDCFATLVGPKAARVGFCYCSHDASSDECRSF